MNNEVIRQVFLMLGTTFLFSLCITPVIKMIAKHVGAMDIQMREKYIKFQCQD